MDRKEIYSKLEGIEGGEAIKDAVKKIFTDLDSDVKKYHESSESLTTKLDGANSDMESLIMSSGMAGYHSSPS